MYGNLFSQYQKFHQFLVLSEQMIYKVKEKFNQQFRNNNENHQKILIQQDRL
jgi:hypothetical protein